MLKKTDNSKDRYYAQKNARSLEANWAKELFFALAARAQEEGWTNKDPRLTRLEWQVADLERQLREHKSRWTECWEHQVRFITKTFGPLSGAGADGARAHLVEELEEVLDALRKSDPEHALEELADVQCLLVGVAANLGFTEAEFLKKWAWKQSVNDRRKWRKCAGGYSKHVEMPSALVDLPEFRRCPCCDQMRAESEWGLVDVCSWCEHGQPGDRLEDLPF